MQVKVLYDWYITSAAYIPYHFAMKYEFLLLAFLSTTVAAFLPYREKHQQIISHRGASGYLPEHSLQAYQLAINLGTGTQFRVFYDELILLLSFYPMISF